MREAVDRAVELLEAAFTGRGEIVFSARDDYGRRSVALTFDDGPSVANTPRLLDLLRAHGARATFFVVGDQIEGREDIVSRLVSEGHELGNHTFTHPHTIALSTQQLREELERTNEALAGIEGVAPIRLVRPPYGKDRRRTDRIGRELGMRTVMWSLNARDTRPGWRSADELAGQVISAARPGSIILFHDGGEERALTIGACEALLASLARSGFEFATVSALLDAGRPTPTERASARSRPPSS